MIYIKKASDYRLKELRLESRVIYNRLTWVDKLYLRKISKLLDSELLFDSTLIVNFNRRVSLALQEFLESRGYEVWTTSYLNTTHIRLKKEHIKPEKDDKETAEEIFNKMRKTQEELLLILETCEPFTLKDVNIVSKDNQVLLESKAKVIEHIDDTAGIHKVIVNISEDAGNISDGYHTFNELYEYRKAYNACLFNEWFRTNKYDVHKSLRHHDGDECFGGGWFVVVAVTPFGQITNHYKMEDFDLFDIPEYETAKYPWDGHTPTEALDRIFKVAKLYGGSDEVSTEDK
jgi:hypothetical protein